MDALLHWLCKGPYPDKEGLYVNEGSKDTNPTTFWLVPWALRPNVSNYAPKLLKKSVGEGCKSPKCRSLTARVCCPRARIRWGDYWMTLTPPIEWKFASFVPFFGRIPVPKQPSWLL